MTASVFRTGRKADDSEEKGMGKTAVIGGGAAGMMAAVFAARNGNQVESI